MPTVAPPPMNRPEAQVAVVHHMLTEHGRSRASELILIDGQAYRLTVEKLTAAEIPEAARQVVQEMTDENSNRRD